MGIDQALSSMTDPISGTYSMDATHRAKIAAHTTAMLYMPGQGRIMAGGLSGAEMSHLAQYMGSRRELVGGAEVEADIDAYMRMRNDVTAGGKYGPELTAERAEKLDTMLDLATKRAAASDPDASQQEIDDAAIEYANALDAEIAKRIAKNLSERAKTVSVMKRHFRNHEGRELTDPEAMQFIEAITGGTSMMGAAEATRVAAMTSQLSIASGLTGEQVTLLHQRARQFVDSGRMANTGLGNYAALSAGALNTAQQSLGTFSGENPLFGIGSANVELEEEAYRASMFAGSDMNQAKIAMYRLRGMVGNLEDGKVKNLLTKLDQGQRLSKEDMDFLKDPSAVQIEMEKAAPGVGSSFVAGLIGDERGNAEYAFYNKENAMAGQRDIQYQDMRNDLDENIQGIVASYQDEGGILGTNLTEEQQLGLTRSVVDDFTRMTPEQIGQVMGETEEGRTLGIQYAKQALLNAIDRGEIAQMSDAELEQAARATYLQARGAVGATTGYGESSSELLVDLNPDTQRKAYRTEKVMQVMADIEKESAKFAGEKGVAGAMALLEAADMDGTGVDMTQIGAALLSGAADEEQAALVRGYRDQLQERLHGLEGVRSGMTTDELASDTGQQLEDDIAVTRAVIEKVDAALNYDDKKTEQDGGEGGEEGGDVYGPGGGKGSGTMTFSNVTIVINDNTAVQNGRGTGSYGGKTAVPTGQNA
jgi:hypothetical protein